MRREQENEKVRETRDVPANGRRGAEGVSVVGERERRTVCGLPQLDTLVVEESVFPSGNDY